MALHANEEPDVHMSKVDDNLETSPLAFTVTFDEPKPESRKLKIHDKLSSFALKHRRNPSLPDFKAVRTARSLETADPEPPPSVNPSKSNTSFFLNKPGYHSEGYFSSDQDEESIKMKRRQSSIPRTKISPVTEVKDFVPHLNGASLPSRIKQVDINNLRRNSLNDAELNVMIKTKSNFHMSTTNNYNEVEPVPEDSCDKSDTVSEAGTYTVDKDGSNDDASEPEVDLNKTIVLCDDANATSTINTREFIPENHKWINEWVRKVAEENFLNPPKEPPLSQQVLSGSGRSSPISKIPSPVNTMPKIKEPVNFKRTDRSIQSKVNGANHRRSSSLNSKDFSEHRTSDSSLETESYLKATESVMTAMQNRMKNNLKLNLSGEISKKTSNRKERIHPPSTASDTDTNSESEAKGVKKPITAPFSSARLNRAFSLRRARADLETESLEKEQKKRAASSTAPLAEKRTTPVRSTPPPPNPKPKPAPFSRTDCGRFSMRSTPTVNKSSPITAPKKDVRKPTTGGRSNSSLSSKEVEFQNWKRRKSFDPMKAAAEGRKKEAAKKAAMTQSLTQANLSPSASMTQSVNLGTTIQMRSGNPVLRSASFHVSPLQPSEPADMDDDLSLEDDEELESAGSSCFSRQPTLPPNSPNKALPKTALLLQRGAAGSRGSVGSVVSETQSSPSRRVRSDLIDSLLISTIADLSIRLKLKSNNLLQKIDSYCDGDERITRIREDLASQSQRGSANNSPSRKSNTRDFPAIVKNLKTVENMLQALDDVIFGGERLDDD